MLAQAARKENLGCDIVAVKIALKSGSNKCMKEVQTLLSLQSDGCGHINILRLLDVFLCGRLIHISLPFAPGGDLFQFVTVRDDQLSEWECKHLVSQIVGALAHLHDQSIAHLDMKPENILLFPIEAMRAHLSTSTAEDVDNSSPARAQPSSVPVIEIPTAAAREDLIHPEINCSAQQPALAFRAKICDFTESVTVNCVTKMQGRCGTHSYMCPEMFQTDAYYHPCQADMWSLGVITTFVMTGDDIFDAPTLELTAQRVLNLRITLPPAIDRRISMEGISFLTWCLRRDVNKRMTADIALNHRWVNKTHKGNHEKQLHQDNHQDKQDTLLLWQSLDTSSRSFPLPAKELCLAMLDGCCSDGIDGVFLVGCSTDTAL